MNDTIFSKVDNYISGLLAQETPAMKHAEELMEANHLPLIHISPVQGKTLQVLAKMCNARNVLELGTLAGYSTLWLADALPDDGKVTTIEYSEDYAAIATQNFSDAGISHKIDQRIGSATEILPVLKEEGKVYDMVFIDADKPPYKEYFDWAVALGRPGTIIVADNVIRNGAVLDANSTDEKVQGVQRLNAYLQDNEQVTAIILQNVGVKEYDGMVVAVVN